MTPRFLNMRQLTDLLGMDRATVYRWIDRDLFPEPEKRGGASLWDLEKCLQAIEKNHLRVRVSFRQLSHLATKSCDLASI